MFMNATFVEVDDAELSRLQADPALQRMLGAERMSQLEIYPGRRSSDADWVMDGFRRLRDFYAGAARKGRAIVTCLV